MLKPLSGDDELWNQVDHRKSAIPAEFDLVVACVDDHGPSSRATSSDSG